MGSVRKRGSRVGNTAHDIAKQLPQELQSYAAWHYAPGGMPDGLRHYRQELTNHLTEVLGFQPAEGFVAQVQNAAAGPVSDWYVVMLGTPRVS
jgi:hypothetical protein